MQLGSDYLANHRMDTFVGNNLLTIVKLGNRAASVNKNNLFDLVIGFRVTDERAKRRKFGAGCQ